MPQITNEPLFPHEVDAMTIRLEHIPNSGWRVLLSARRGAAKYEEKDRATYSDLSPAELLDTITSELVSALAL